MDYFEAIAKEYKKHYDAAHILDMTMGDENERSYHAFIYHSILKGMYESTNKEKHLEVLKWVMSLPMFDCAICYSPVYNNDMNNYQKHSDLCPQCSKMEG